MFRILTSPGEHCGIVLLRAESYWNVQGEEKKSAGRQSSTQWKHVGQDQKWPTFKPGHSCVVGSPEPDFHSRVVTMA